MNFRNVNLNKTIKYENNKILPERDSGEHIRKNNSNLNSDKRINENEDNLGVFNDNDNYTNLISQINNINNKYGIPSKISLSSKSSKSKIIESSNNDNINNNNITNNIVQI